MTEDELKTISIDLAILDALYKKWGEEDSSLSGVTNAKLITPKNQQLQAKLDAWKNRVTERKATKKRNFEHGKALREYFSKVDDYRNDKHLVENCIQKYQEFSEKMDFLRK